MHRPQGKIRPPRKPLNRRNGLTDAQEFEACWNMLNEALTDIHNRNAGKLSFEQLYRASYKIVLKRRGQDLYEKVGKFEVDWFTDKVIPPIFDLVSGNLVSLALGDLPGTTTLERQAMSEKFLRGLGESWERHLHANAMIADIMMYLDRGQALDQSRPQLYMTVLGLYRDNILRREFPTINGPLTDVVNAVVFDLINMDRKGEIIDKQLIKRLLGMYETLAETDDLVDDNRLYRTTFEPSYLEDSRQFYEVEADQLIREGDASNWLRHTLTRLNEEKERCNTTIYPQTTSKIVTVVEEQLIAKHLDKFLELEGSGLRAMIDNDRIEDLAKLYEIVCMVPSGIDKVKKIMQQRVVMLGLEIEKALKEANFSAQQPAADGEEAKPLTGSARLTASAVRWVDDVLKLKDKFDTFLRECFRGDKILESALTKSFSEFINMFKRCSEFVSLFIDDNLKNGMRGKTEAEVDESMEKAIILVRYLQDRDMFQRYYQKHLARRLLHGKSESQDAEKQLISRMKQEIGSHFTSKFEGMFKDMDTSRDLTAGYHDHIRDLGDMDRKVIDLNINVLTSNNWPPDGMMLRDSDGSRAQCNWPPEIQGLQASFFKYYLTERNGRVLTWVGNAGTADIKCVFPKVPGKETGPLSKERRYELTVSTHGMVVLMLFNELSEGEWLGFDEIQAATNIPTPELSRTLASLSLAPKSRVLLKDPMTKNIKPEDKFAFNFSFVSKQVKIRAPIVSAQSKVEGDEERKETEKKNDESRLAIVDAAIVRIMKARKELAHNLLITEVVNVLSGRFKPDLPLVKKRIEDLIAREFLERAEDTDATQQVYRYLA
ncbi:Cullin-3A [Cytospora mali]|uniref:Cullin-3A n=1 Tax=Cytospora mali TaxID=578113 RepID=A0A194V0Z5_CYTMA|nr:Cullin-3A [Valsa mali var. pyri (nom. inval.)]